MNFHVHVEVRKEFLSGPWHPASLPPGPLAGQLASRPHGQLGRPGWPAGGGEMLPQQPALLAATSAKNAYEFEAAPHARWKSCSLIVLIATFAIHLAACSLFAMCSSAKLELSQGKYATAEVPPEASPSRPTHVPCGTQRTCSRVHIALNLMRLETA